MEYDNWHNVNEIPPVEVSLVFDEYTAMVNELSIILSCLKEIRIPPEQIQSIELLYPVNQKNFDGASFKLAYDSEIEQQIQVSKLVVVVTTNSLIASQKCTGLLRKAKECGIPVFSLLMEQIENLSEHLELVDQHFKVFEDRVCPTGYDQYAWIGRNFEMFLEQLGHVVGKELVSYQLCFFK